MLDRWTIDEVLLRYELEPALKDIFVEGEFDALVIKWFLREKADLTKPLSHLVVFEIDLVQVDNALLSELGLNTNSNRSRVIALGTLFSRRYPLGTQLTCIVDADFDYARPQKTLPACTLSTDYASLDAYLFEDRPISKFLALVQPNFPKTASELIDELLVITHEVFLVRLTNEELGWGCQFLDFERCLSVDNGNLSLDVEDYTDRYLAKSAKTAQKSEFATRKSQIKNTMRGDRRLFVNGHDLIGCMTWAVIKLGRQNGLVAKALVANGLPGCIESVDLEQHALFVNLLKRVLPSPAV